jgi:hypothetical protein
MLIWFVAIYLAVSVGIGLYVSRRVKNTAVRAAQALQTGLYALLAGNTLWFAVIGPWTKALDSLAWFALLMLFALETGNARWLDRKHITGAVHLLRFLATAAIVASAVGYVNERDWLDAVNTGLWILVVVLLECELRYPQAVARRRRLFTATAIALYAGIAALLPLWALHGEWFDAYDAVLWLVAFALIEMDALKLARQG